MRWDCDARIRRLENWHGWFAWHPVKVGPSDCRWLETVWRKGTLHTAGYVCDFWWTWEYKSYVDTPPRPSD